MKLTKLVECMHRGFSDRIIAIYQTDFVMLHVVGIQLCILQRLPRSHISILCLFGHKLALIARNEWFQIGFGHIGTQG